MVHFLGRWLTQALRLVLSLGFGLASMQLPALAEQYAAALLQVAESGARDIDQREASARSFYPAAGPGREALIAALDKVEPANAQALRVSIGRAAALSAAHRRLDATTPMLRPVVAALDVADDPAPEKRTILQTTLATYKPQILLTGASLAYGLAGLLLGSLLAEAISSLLGRLLRRRPDPTRPGRREWAAR